jgi:transcriptional regulator with XRE-family HTH domain
MNEAALKSVVPVIGNFLRIFREKTRKSQGEVARKAGISISMLSQIERGMVSPSIDTLFNVCNGVGMDIGELFRRLSADAPVRLQRAGQRLGTQHGGILFEQLAASTSANHPAELFLLEVRPGKRVGMSIGGHEGVEMGYVLEGDALLGVVGLEYQLKAGDSVSFNANLPHSLVNPGKRTFRAVWAAVPPHKDYLENTIR